LKPASLSGYWRNWAVDHRGVTTRLSAETGDRSRIEHRMGDGAANPYTAVAVVLQAARLGLAGGHELPPAETGDCNRSPGCTGGGARQPWRALWRPWRRITSSWQPWRGRWSRTIFSSNGTRSRRQASLEGDSLRDFYIYYV